MLAAPQAHLAIQICTRWESSWVAPNRDFFGFGRAAESLRTGIQASVWQAGQLAGDLGIRKEASGGI